MNFPNPEDNQAVFNFIINHLRKQGKQATDVKGGCVYRTDDGEACAVGCLIPEDEYHSKFEGEPVNRYSQKMIGGKYEEDVENEITNWVRSKGYDSKLLCELQWLHDDVHNWEPENDWIKEDAIQRYAEKLELTYS
jgi:hypothetical protein